MVIVLHNHLIDRLAFVNGIISGIALYPQVFGVLANGSAAGVSLFTFLIIFINSFVWLAYSIHRGLISLGIASVFNLIASAVLIGSIIILGS